MDNSDAHGHSQAGGYTTQGESQGQSQAGGYTNASSNPNTQEFKLSGDDIMAKVKELVHEGNVRRITIKNEQGDSILEFPLTAGVIGVALLPVWAAIGAVLALAANCTIVVERRD
jgi:hypothetical protein